MSARVRTRPHAAARTPCRGACDAARGPRAASSRASLDTAIAGRPIALPHRAALERAFGRSLGDVPVHADDAARAALVARGAEAAAYRGHVLLASPAAPLRTVAHEVAHVLQGRGAARDVAHDGAHGDTDDVAHGRTSDRTPDATPATASRQAEVEAESLALRAEARTGGHGDPLAFVPLVPQVTLAGGTLALRAARAPVPVAAPRAPTAVPSSASAGPSSASTSSSRAESGRVVGVIPRATEGAPATPVRVVRDAATTDGATADATAAPLAATEVASTVSAEQVAQRDAALAAARTSLDAADSATGVLDAFAAAPPSLKAQLAGEIGTRLDGALAQEATALGEATPVIAVDIDHGDAPAPTAVRYEAPAAQPVALDGGATVAPAPSDVRDPALPPYDDPNRFAAQMVTQLFGGAGSDPAAVGAALDGVRTANPGIATSAGPSPAIPLEGAGDPSRLEAQRDAGAAHVRDAHEAAHAAIADGPGPEVVQPRSMVAEGGSVAIPDVAVAAPTVPAGAGEYVALGLPPEVQVAFDAQQGAAMSASLADAQAQAHDAAAARDTAHADAVREAERGRDAARDEAEAAQRDAVGEARGGIEAERTRTFEAQRAAVADVERDAEARRATDRADADERVAREQGRIDDRYDAAGRTAAAEVRDGERRAEERRAQAERDAASQSWWERAASWVRAAFDALVSAIGTIFDAVRAAVNVVLDAARDFALGLIAAVASALRELVAAFGTFLVGLIDDLLGDVFPGLAAALTGAVHRMVARAQRAIDRAAAALSSAVNDVVDGLRRAVNAALDVFQGALTAVTRVVQAALSGDWAALARMAFEAVLGVLGLDPAAVYAVLGEAETTLRTIIDAPGAFLGNLVRAFTSGIERFATNLGTHLVNGIVGWLTGALGGAGITLPERFDLMGVLSLVGQLLGLTWQRLRERIVRVIGERAMGVLEFVASYVETLVTGGFGALWDRLVGDLATLRDTVLGMIREWLVERVILAAVSHLAMMFSPVGALLNVVMTIWNVVSFLRDQLARIMAVAQAVLGAVGEIAQGVIDRAAGTVESTLGALLPLALDFLARLLRLGDVGGRVREIVQSVQEAVWRGIDAFIGRVRGMFRGGSTAPAGDVAAPTAAAPTSDRDPDHVRTLPMPLPGESHAVTIAFRAGALAISIASRRQGLLLDVLRDASAEARERARTSRSDARREYESLAGMLDNARGEVTTTALEQAFQSAGAPGYQRAGGERIPLNESVAFHVFVERRLTELVGMMRTAFASAPLHSLDRLFEATQLAGPRYLPVQCRGGRWIRPRLYEAGRSWQSFRDPIVADARRAIARRVTDAHGAATVADAATIWNELVTAHQVERSMTLGTTNAATIAATAYDLDHVTSTSSHWNTRGGNGMSDTARQAFYFDEANLRVVTAEYNRSRAADDANYVPYVDTDFSSRLAAHGATEIIVDGTTRLPFLDDRNRPLP